MLVHYPSHQTSTHNPLTKCEISLLDNPLQFYALFKDKLGGSLSKCGNSLPKEKAQNQALSMFDIKARLSRMPLRWSFSSSSFMQTFPWPFSSNIFSRTESLPITS